MLHTLTKTAQGIYTRQLDFLNCQTAHVLFTEYKKISKLSSNIRFTCTLDTRINQQSVLLYKSN